MLGPTSTSASTPSRCRYEGSYELDEATLEDGTILDDHLSAMGGWIASTLVKLGDLKLPFLPPVEEES